MAEMKLKPCPFCGHTQGDMAGPILASFEQGGKQWWSVRCGCEVMTSDDQTAGQGWAFPEDAVKAWNDRTEPVPVMDDEDAHAREVERLTVKMYRMVMALRSAEKFLLSRLEDQYAGGPKYPTLGSCIAQVQEALKND